VGAKEAERTISKVPADLGDYFRSVGIDTSNVFIVDRDASNPDVLVKEIRRLRRAKQVLH